MQGKKWRWLKIIALCLNTFLWPGEATAFAQEGGAPTQLFITGSDVSSPPAIELHVYGRDSEGRPLNLAQETLSIRHNGVPVSQIEQIGAYQAGTFTVFLIDIPTGVAGQIPAIQDAINQYANAPTMTEQVDAVAIYQAGETTATQLLAPDTFYNSVRNFFATSLQPEVEATALIDSIMGLLEQINSLKLSPDMAPFLVVMSDGTDAISTQFQPGEVATRAATLGIPIHTIWLNNADLSPPSQLAGQQYLAEVAGGSGGIAVRLENTADLSTIWERIASFRSQARLRYTVDDLSGGDFQVEVSLANNPQVSAATTVTIPGNIPSVIINLPPESRTLTLPNLEDPVGLRFSTTVSWLDGVERQLEAAQLVVNGTVVQDIPVEQIEQFEAQINNLAFGANSVQVAVLDEQGMRVTSPVLLLTVTEGGREVPGELEAGGSLGQTLVRLFLILLVIALLAGLGFIAWRGNLLSRLPALASRGRSPRVQTGRAKPAPAAQAADGPPRPIAHLDVLESTSTAIKHIPLSAAEVRIGRSPAQADVAFENDITVSRLHAILMLEGRHYRIFDAKSTSGTWVNEHQVPEYGIQLVDGDEIHLGAVHLRFRQS